MSTYTWVTTGHSQTGAIVGASLPALSLGAPANGIIKRFQLRANLLSAEVDGIGVSTIGPVQIQQNVQFNDGIHVPRNIFSANRAVPMAATALYDPATLQRVYSAYYAAGDNELEVNQGTSYGKHTDSFPKGLICNVSIFVGTSGLLPGLSGTFEFTFAMLYLTL